ncbi:MAG: hypothetical protein J6Y03_03645 [Alphaproteobacteria bacterium]|nr:hypothetical protein [Alphaproteobacteria bacterium]
MSSSFWYSLFGHVLIGLLFLISLPTFQKEQEPLSSAPVFIDLKTMEITDKTNLPPKVVKKEQTKKPAVKENKEPAKIETKIKKTDPVPEKVEPVQKVEPIKDAVKTVVNKPEKKPDPLPKVKPKIPQKPPVKPKQVQPKPKSRPKEDDDGLDSLLASVEKMSKTTKPVPKKKTDDVSDLISGVLNGVENAPAQTSIDNKLTVSQIDFISAEVRKHWNFDAGIEGIENMIVDLRISLTREGRVEKVEFLNQRRFNQDPSFRSIAESAKRAVLKSDGTDESPFRVLAVKYPERYSEWKNLQLKFSPLEN